MWECYVRSGGKRNDGYMKKVKEMWDGRDLSVRGIPSLVAQLKQIEANSLLTVVERGEIERRVLGDTVENVEENQVHFVLEEVEDGNEVGSEGKVDEGGDTVEVVEEDLVELVLKELEDDNLLEGMLTVDEEDDTVKVVEGNFVDLVLKELEDDNELEGVMTDDTVEVVKADYVDLVLKELEDDKELGGVATAVQGSDMVEIVESDLVDMVLRELEDDNELEGRMTSNEGELNIGANVRVTLERIDIWKNGEVSRALTVEEKKVLKELREVVGNGETVEVPSLKSVDRRKVMVEVELVEGLMHNLVSEGMSVTEVNRLLYAGSFMVASRLGMIKKKDRKKEAKKKPAWQRRIEGNILRWRKDLSRTEEIRKGVCVSERIKGELDRRYDFVEKGAAAVSTMLKGKISAGSKKVKNFVGKGVACRQNNLFRNNQSQLYKELGGTAKTGGEASPNADEAKEFWSKIWSVDKQHDGDASWLGSVKEKLGGVEQMEDIAVSLEDVKAGIRKMANWKAPGPDGVRGFWFKKFQSLHSPMTGALQSLIRLGEVPEWLVKGRTVLIQKDPAKGTVASNYRPIACLPLMWKLLTGIFADKIYDHLLANNVLPDEQKGCRRGSRGTKDQLLIDKVILREVRRKKRCLSVAWIDYKKAYDMVPHSWIREMLDVVKVAGNLKGLLTNSMADWKTVLTANGEMLGEVDIRRGIFQGDSLSPLLFIIVMIPLSILLKREKLGYSFGSDGKLINHLLFMDDLKLFGKTERELEGLVDLVSVYSRDIGMEFGLEKCASLVIRRGVKEGNDGIELPNGEMMKEVDANGYKYLGVLEGADIKNREMKDKVSGEYLRRVKLVAKSKLYGGNVIKALNVWAVSVVRYSAGILDWSDKELKKLDIRTRKILAMTGVFHIRSSVDRLYRKRKDGGRGLISVVDCVRGEEIALSEYVKGSEEWMLKVVAGGIEVGESKIEYFRRVDNERREKLKEKRLHGKFVVDVEAVADNRSWQWLRAGYLAKSTEAYLFAAQEQALRTRFFRKTIEGEDCDGECRVCGETVESVGHLASGCSGLAQKEYRRRHDKMGLRVYWELCRKYGLKCAGKWFEEVPDEVRSREDGKVEIWWDKSVETTNKLEHNRPDVVVVDRVRKKWVIVDFAVPWDKNVWSKENEKIGKYAPLALEVRRLYGVATQVIPVVVGALGVVSRRLGGYLKELGIPDVLGGLQTSAIVGTANILRKTLNT